METRLNEASMRTVKIHSDQNKPSLQIKENSVLWYNNESKRSQNVNEKSKGTIYLCTQTIGTLVTSISEYGIEFWAITGLEKLEKKSYNYTN